MTRNVWNVARLRAQKNLSMHSEGFSWVLKTDLASGLSRRDWVSEKYVTISGGDTDRRKKHCENMDLDSVSIEMLTSRWNAL
jgi:hypothetical protein